MESENNYNLSIIQLPVCQADDSFGYFDEGLEKLSSSNTRLIREFLKRDITNFSLTNPILSDILIFVKKAVKGSSTQPADAQREAGWCKAL